MHRWPVYLADLPAALLWLVAAANRISLPRRSTPAERLARVRQALCRPAAVRAVYFALPVEARAAAQELRRAPRCITPDAVTAQFGPLRPLAELRRDRAPRSIAELLLLHGWLLPRRASRNHPVRYVVPPEVREWLPRPIQADFCHKTAPDAATTLAVRGATAILVAAAAAPLPLRRDGRLTAAALRRIQPLLVDIPAPELAALAAWAMPLLTGLDLLAPHGAAAAPAPAAARFFAASARDRLRMLRDSWAHAPHAEPGLLPPRASRLRVHWSVLRRRLLLWAEARPAGSSAEASFETLTAAFGPLADGFTHYSSAWRRPPWAQRTALAVWARALEGPLAWLGVQGVGSKEQGAGSGAQSAAMGARVLWAYGDAGKVSIPHDAAGAELLAVAPFAQEISGDTAGLTVQLTCATVARALGRGHDPARLRAALEQRAGPLPDSWAELLAPAGSVRLLRRAVLLADEPAALQGALRRPVVRRNVEAVVAPGVVLVAPGRERTLAEQLTRHGHVVSALEPLPAPARPPAELTQAEVAALLVASAHYRATAPAGAPLGPSDVLIERLRELLPPRLGAATDEAITALREPRDVGSPPAPPAAPAPAAGTRPSEVELLWQLREAIRRREAVQIVYQGADDAVPRARTIRPVSLERHGDLWYLNAYCLLARADRCFRLDRVEGLAPTEAAPQAPARRQPRARHRRAPRLGVVAGPPIPPVGSRLVGVWLEDDWPGPSPTPFPAGLDEIVGRVAGDLAEAVDEDALHGVGVEPVAAHAVGPGIDQRAEPAAEGDELGLVQVALEDAALYP